MDYNGILEQVQGTYVAQAALTLPPAVTAEDRDYAKLTEATPVWCASPSGARRPSEPNTAIRSGRPSGRTRSREWPTHSQQASEAPRTLHTGPPGRHIYLHHAVLGTRINAGISG